MDLPLNSLVIFLVINTILLLYLSVQFWLRRNVKGGYYIFILMVAVTFWSLAAFHEASAAGENSKLFWGTLSYLGIVLVGPLLALFSLEYTQQPADYVKKLRPFLFIIPAMTVLLVVFNNQTKLVWVDIIANLTDVHAPLVYVHGAAFYVNWLYQLVLSGFAVINLFQYSLRQFEERKIQLLWTNIAIVIPLLANVLYHLFLSDLITVDVTPFAFSLSGLAIFYGMFRHKFFEVRPEAREYAFKHLKSGVLTFSKDGDLINTNERVSELLGQNITSIADLHLSPEVQEGILYWQETRLWLEYRVFDLSLIATQGGTIVTIYDISEIKQAEKNIQKEESLLTAVVETIPDGLFAVDAEGKVTQWNCQMEVITGIQAIEIIGKPVIDFTIRVYGKRQPTLADAVVDESIYWAEFKNIKKSGGNLTKLLSIGKKQYVATAAKILNDEGLCIGAIETLRDVTNQRKHESALSNHMNELLALNEVMIQREEELSKLARLGKS